MLSTSVIFLPARHMQVVLRRPAVRLPGWLKSWMNACKQLGLLSLLAGECVQGLWGGGLEGETCLKHGHSVCIV